jgi:hypothetical protein
MKFQYTISFIVPAPQDHIVAADEYLISPDLTKGADIVHGGPLIRQEKPLNMQRHRYRIAIMILGCISYA